MQTLYIWTGPYQAALFEVDPEKMKDHALRAEEIIELRKEELLREPVPDAKELQALTRALKVLALLKEIANKHT